MFKLWDVGPIGPRFDLERNAPRHTAVYNGPFFLVHHWSRHEFVECIATFRSSLRDTLFNNSCRADDPDRDFPKEPVLLDFLHEDLRFPERPSRVFVMQLAE